jgi:hypothetical protein
MAVVVVVEAVVLVLPLAVAVVFHNLLTILTQSQTMHLLHQ